MSAFQRLHSFVTNQYSLTYALLSYRIPLISSTGHLPFSSFLTRKHFGSTTVNEESDHSDSDSSIEYDSDSDNEEIEMDSDDENDEQFQSKSLQKVKKSQEFFINYRKSQKLFYEPPENAAEKFTYHPMPRLPGPSPFINPEYKYQRNSRQYRSLEILRMPLSCTHPLGGIPEAWIFNSNNQRQSIIPLSADIFNHEIRIDLLYRAVKYEQNKQLGFTWHIVKNRGEIPGSGKKKRPQKKTGKARMSDGKAPQFLGGGHAHGRRPRDMTTNISSNVYEHGFKIALSARFMEGDLLIWEDYVLPSLMKPLHIDFENVNKHKELSNLIPVEQLDYNQNTRLNVSVDRCRQMFRRFNWLKPGLHERISSMKQFEEISAAKKTGNIVDIFESMPVSEFQWDFLREEEDLEDIAIVSVLMVHNGYVHQSFSEQIARVKGIDLVSVDDLFDCMGVFRLLKYKKIVLNIPALQAITDRIGAENEVYRWNYNAKLNGIREDENCKPAFPVDV